jgi:hypothetical protein
MTNKQSVSRDFLPLSANAVRKLTSCIDSRYVALDARAELLACSKSLKTLLNCRHKS